MGDAYKCDLCGLFKEGRPAKKLYEKEYDRSQSEIYVEYMILCSVCEGKFE